MQYIIQTQNLTKKFGKKAAVNTVSLHVKKGDIYGLIGKNGAGKTTLMRLLLGLTNANSGEIDLFSDKDLIAGRRRIGALIENPALYKNETAFENMRRFAILSPTSDEEIARLLNLVGLGYTGKKKVKQFSLGMRQRLGIAVAMLGNPEVMILDEPVNGLDPAGIKEIRNIILELNAKGVTFLISSHLLDELGRIATTFGIMNDGVLVEEIATADLVNMCRTSVKVTVNNPDAAASILTANYPDIQLETNENILYIRSDIGDRSKIVELLVKNDIRVYEITSESMNLEEFFIERLGR